MKPLIFLGCTVALVSFTTSSNAIPLGHNAINYFEKAKDSIIVQEQIDNYTKAISLYPQYAEAYCNRATVKYLNLQDIQGALADYNKAITINPKYFKAYNSRALLKKQKLNDFQGALNDYNQAVPLDSEDNSAYLGRAILKHQKLNDFQGALSDYNQAIVIEPIYAISYLNRALLKHYKLNDSQGALADYNRAISLKFGFIAAYQGRASLKHYKLNDFQGALADYNQAISIKPKFAGFYNDRAILKFDSLKDSVGALADIKQAISLDSQYSKYLAYFTTPIKKQTTAEIVNEINSGSAELTRITNSKAYYDAGIEKEKQNDIPGALGEYSKAIETRPDFAAPYLKRGLLKIKRGDETAAQDLRTAARLFREQGNNSASKIAIDVLKIIGATE
jgi:tetratricopeptide (TPR) repeat protein